MLTQEQMLREGNLSREQVVDEIKRIISESCGVPLEQLGENTDLLRDVAWDSLDKVECAMELEEQFDISISDEFIDETKTIGGVADGILLLLSQRGEKE